VRWVTIEGLSEAYFAHFGRPLLSTATDEYAGIDGLSKAEWKALGWILKAWG
jgi:hypothetical protein